MTDCEKIFMRDPVLAPGVWQETTPMTQIRPNVVTSENIWKPHLNEETMAHGRTGPHLGVFSCLDKKALISVTDRR